MDGCGLYDIIPASADGSAFSNPRELWLEISPRSFNVRVREGVALTQLMVFMPWDKVHRLLPPHAHAAFVPKPLSKKSFVVTLSPLCKSTSLDVLDAFVLHSQDILIRPHLRRGFSAETPVFRFSRPINRFQSTTPIKPTSRLLRRRRRLTTPRFTAPRRSPASQSAARSPGPVLESGRRTGRGGPAATSWEPGARGRRAGPRCWTCTRRRYASTPPARRSRFRRVRPCAVGRPRPGAWRAASASRRFFDPPERRRR